MKSKTGWGLLVCACVLLGGVAPGWAQDQPKDKAETEAHKLVQALKYQHGQIVLAGGLATLKLPANLSYLSPDDTAIVLEKLWGNPPQAKKLGLLIPTDKTPLDPGCWAVTIATTEDGYVKDDDAGKIKYDELLKQMQTAIHDHNAERTAHGYPAMELVGWAEPPHYDAATHKLYWAKELKIEGEDAHTLNYDIRILGRHGVLVLSAIAGMDQLAEIRQQSPGILAMIDFNEGNRYGDFDPKVDKVATYGIAALVAGGIAAKLGFFKLLWVGLLAAKKFIVIGVLAVVAWVKKLLRKRSDPPV